MSGVGLTASHRINNIDWLRLIFAAQVALLHAVSHLTDARIPVLGNFPGVPAFFFYSGFLIYGSYIKSPSTWRYFLNRFLRLMPALICVTAGGAIVAIIAKGSAHLQENLGLYASWFVAQITLGQAYNPADFRSVGVGVINGALWTITVEILFYLAVPIIVIIERRLAWITYALFIVSFAIYAGGETWLSVQLAGHSLYDFLALTPVVWGWMFAAGMLCFKHFARIAPYTDKLWICALPMVALILLDESGPLFSSSSNHLGLLYFLAYVGFSLYIAFGIKAAPPKNDLSYGVYVWHMVVINALLVVGYPSPVLALVLTFLFAGLSWRFVEKPALALKRYSLRSA
ncbi:MAG: acyltransferase [Pseudomonadota bacterium]